MGDVMYQSLYRKYRPKNFDEVVGQDIPVKILQNAIKNDRIAHAYLFAGIRGTGKTSIAKIFAKAVNCQSRESYNPCNNCVICTQNNVDIVEIDAASNNGVDEIRELRDKIALVPSVSKYKVYIIDEVHMLSTSAFNALLKTLEEPPAHAIFILATTEVYKIPLTILSRCQRLDFKSITIPNIIKRLEYICKEENIKIEENAIREIARLSNGGMRDSISLLEQVWAYSDNITIDDVHKMNGTLGKEEVTNLFNFIGNNDIQNCFNLINKYEEIGTDFSKTIDELIYFVHNLILFKNDINVEDNLYLKEDYNKVKDVLNIEKLIELMRRLNIASNEIKTVSNKKLIFEMFIINSIENKEKKESKIISKKEVNEDIPAVAIVNPAYVEKIKSDFSKLNENKVQDEPKEPIKNEDVQTIKNIRLNNALAEFDKRVLNSFQKKLESLKDYAIDLEYNETAMLLIDGKLKVASKEYLVYVYEEELVSRKFNSNIFKIEELIKIITGNDLKVISINNDEWEIVKEEFNSKKKKYEKKEETEEIRKIINNLNKIPADFLEENFSDIITYE